jgi:general secretion pathway protein C
MQFDVQSSVAVNFGRTVEKLLAHRATQTAVTVSALLLLSWGFAQGTWRVWQPASPAIDRSGSADAIDLKTLFSARPFGSAAPSPANDDASVARSTLNLSLTGVAMLRSGGCALIVVQGQPESAYCMGEDLSPGVRLVGVQRDRVVILRNGTRESVLMKDAEDSPQMSAAAAPQATVESTGLERRLVDRRQLQQQLGRPEFLNQALIVPNPAGGGGFLVREVQTGSLYEKLGLRPGDVIRTVNGQPLTNMDDVMKLYQQFGSVQRVLVDVQRQGRSETLYYDMR